MRIHQIHDIQANHVNQSDPKPLDLDRFAAELKELSARHNLQLISLGAMAMDNATGPGTSYLAIWSTPAASDENSK